MRTTRLPLIALLSLASCAAPPRGTTPSPIRAPVPVTPVVAAPPTHEAVGYPSLAIENGWRPLFAAAPWAGPSVSLVCQRHRTDPDCPESWSLRSLEVTGQRWAGLFTGLRYEASLVVVSDDAGTTARSFPAPAGWLRVHQFADRVFVLQSTSAAEAALFGSVLHEMDPRTGTFRRPAGDTDFGDAEAAWFRDGDLVSVSFTRSSTIRVAKFRARDNASEAFELSCTVEGCDQSGSPSFESKTGVVFTAVATPAGTRDRECTVTVDVARKTVASTCRKAPAPAGDAGFVIGVGPARILQPASGPAALYARWDDQWFLVRFPEHGGDDPLCFPVDNTGSLVATCARTVDYLQIANATSVIVVTKERQYKDASTTQWREVFRSKLVRVRLTPVANPFERPRG